MAVFIREVSHHQRKATQTHHHGTGVCPEMKLIYESLNEMGGNAQSQSQDSADSKMICISRTVTVSPCVEPDERIWIKQKRRERERESDFNYANGDVSRNTVAQEEFGRLL